MAKELPFPYVRGYNEDSSQHTDRNLFDISLRGGFHDEKRVSVLSGKDVTDSPSVPIMAAMPSKIKVLPLNHLLDSAAGLSLYNNDG